jgi:hypothetical protein
MQAQSDCTLLKLNNTNSSIIAIGRTLHNSPPIARLYLYLLQKNFKSSKGDFGIPSGITLGPGVTDLQADPK